MMQAKLVLVLIWSIGISAWTTPNYSGYETWLQTPDLWIRVGIKKPEKVLELYSMNTLLVLDGRKVVKTIQPRGEFRVLVDGKAGVKPSFWVQLRAEKSASSLKAEMNQLQQKYPDLRFAVMPSKSFQVLRMGPFNSRNRAERMKRLAQGGGYADAFIVSLKAGRGYFWVNDRFDKFPLQVNDLALVSTNPESPIRFGGNGYRGILRLRYDNGRIRVINELPLETYLRGVVPSELGPKVFPAIEALKAQAVAARTYAIKNLKRFHRKGYDICDSPACQAYDGVKNEDELSDIAVFETKGLVLYHQDTLIDALYTSTCGGHTDDVENVFPGRHEPYLRGKSSYLATYSRWTLPPKAVNGLVVKSAHQDLQIRAMLYGLANPPKLDGSFNGEALRAALADLSWIFGKIPDISFDGSLTHKQFWQVFAELEIVADTVAQQVHPSELEKIQRQYKLSPVFQGLAAFLLRFDLIAGATPHRLEADTSITALEAYEYLLGMAQAFGPEPEWKRYRIAGKNGNQLRLKRGSGHRDLDLGRIRHYITQVGNQLVFRQGGEIEAHDNVFLVKKPFPGLFLRLHEASRVASVDRFSVFDSWIEKKSVTSLEKRARRYVSQLRGLRDIRILKRSDTGRVTLLEFIADSGRYQVDGLRIRWSLGIRENLFNMLPIYKNNRLVHATFFGRGWGHGVGMSQVGAYGLAQMGWTFDRILKHYYEGVRLVPFQEK